MHVPSVLRDYILLADGERGAILGPRGDVAWLCAPSWDSGSVFGSLLGAPGTYTVCPHGRYVWGGHYRPGSLVWCSRWITEDGVVQCLEALAYPGDAHRAVLLRRVQPVDRDACVDVTLSPHADYGRARLREPRIEDGVWHGRAGGLYLRWSGAADARWTDEGGADEPGWRTQLKVAAGGRHDLVLELSDRPLPDEPVRPDAAWERTLSAWVDAVPGFGASLAPEQSRHSYAVLRGLTRPGGGMVAAATTSLPEHAEAGRNYDYRYVWIRDQSYAGQAVAADAAHPLLDDAVAFVGERLLADGPRLAPAYTIDGAPVPKTRPLQVPGYPGSEPHVGNGAGSQFQLDAFGEALLLFAAAARHDHLDDAGWHAADAAVGAIAQRWREPDAGVWELENRPWTHSRLTAAAGLRALAATHPKAARAADLLGLADTITAHTAAHATAPDGYWQRTPDDPKLDGALLLAGLRGAVPVDDRRTDCTLDAYLRQLTTQGYAYRFRHGDGPLGEAEGSFLMCGFITALALHQRGDDLDALRWFERSRAACGPAQLFSEEYDVTENQQRGNLPQAFVHAFMLEAAVRLAREPDRQKERPS